MTISFNRNLFAIRAQRQLGVAENLLTRSLERLSSGSRLNRPSDDAALYAGDFNNDGYDDILAAHNAGDQMKVILNGGRRSFAAANYNQQIAFSNPVSGQIDEMVLADVNNDGNLDILDAYGGDLVAYFGNGNGTMQSAATIADLSATTMLGAVVADFNHDGLNDIVSDHSLGAGSIGILFGQANGQFQSRSITMPIVGNASSLRSADFNNDGDMDVLLGWGTSNFILYGKGDGTFDAAATVLSSFSSPDDITVADFTGDGVSDIVAGVGSESRVFWGGAESSTSFQRIDLNTRSSALAAIQIIDAALERVRKERSTLGALQSRIETASRNLSAIREGYISADSRITDADIADESSRSIRSRILQQTASAVLAQANQSSQIGLELLFSAGISKER